MSLVTPKLKVLTATQIEKVHHDAVAILETTGITVEDTGARSLFEEAVGKPRSDRRVRIPGDLTEWAIQTSPSTISLYNRSKEFCFELTGSEPRPPVFGIGVTNLYYQNPYNGEIGPFHRKHMAAAAGLGNTLDGYDLVSTPGVIRDLPPETADLYGVLEMLANTTKPLVLLISDSRSFDPALDLCEHLTGDIAENPRLLPYVNPITPLVLNAETSLKMDVAIKRGLPLIFSNYGMSGATCPITPGGTLALLTAELLAGLVYSQLVKEGTPVILGSLPAAFDMKTAGSFYSPHTLLLNLACAEMMARYHVPHCGTSGSTQGWGADLLTGTTLCMNHLSSCLGMTGMIPFVGGNFDSLVFSPELAVYANDVICQARGFASGFSLDDEEVGLSNIAEVGPGGNFLMSEFTTKRCRDARFSSTLWPNLSLEKWMDQGKPTAAQVLRDRTCELLDRPNLPADHDDIRSRGEAYLRE